MCKAYNSGSLPPYASETLVTDVYVYYFMRCGGAVGDNILSKRRATLETIKDKGETVIWNRRP